VAYRRSPVGRRTRVAIPGVDVEKVGEDMAGPTLVLLIAQLGLVLVVAMILGHLAERLRLPPIVGHLMAGVVLGPTLFGAVLPRLYATVFPAHGTISAALKTARVDFLQVGLLLFIFFVGLEIDVGTLRERLRTIVPTSIFGIIVPFAAGFAMVFLFPHLWQAPMADKPLALPFVMAVALSITALPVIAAIIADLGLLRTQVGQIILSAAVIDDLYGWLSFAAVAAVFSSSKGTTLPLWMIVLILLGTFALTLTVGRKLGSRAAQWAERHAQQGLLALGLTLALALLASAVMEGVGAHAFFGALIVGLAFSGANPRFLEPVERVVRAFFAPLYFGAVGLSVNFVTNFDVGLVTVVFLVACAGKFAGATFGARLGGSPLRESLAIASGMNARGAIEIILATVMLSAGLITNRIFVAVVVMALATSVLAGYLLQAILHVKRPAKLVKARVPVLQRLDPYGRPVEEIEIGPRLTIGRDWSNRLALPDDELVSREHALLRPVDGHFRIEDLGSANGTLIWRDTRWQEVELDDVEDGDMLVIGKNVFRFSQGVRARGEGKPVGASAQAQEV
jgi:Kef-type K+ transport system membrane component KefB